MASKCCCVGTCTNRAVYGIKFAPHGRHQFRYCTYHARSRDGSRWRWAQWLIIEAVRL